MEVVRAPNNKVPANNLPKLAPDKKIVPITVDIALGDFILRDRFDWDLNQTCLRPIDFARALLTQVAGAEQIQASEDSIKRMA